MIQQVVSLSQSSCVLPAELADRRWWGRTQIIQRLKSLVLYKIIHYSLLPPVGLGHTPLVQGGGGDVTSRIIRILQLIAYPVIRIHVPKSN